MSKTRITRHTSDSLTGRRMMSAKGARNVSDKPVAMTKEQQDWNNRVEMAKIMKKEMQRGEPKR